MIVAYAPTRHSANRIPWKIEVVAFRGGGTARLGSFEFFSARYSPLRILEMN